MTPLTFCWLFIKGSKKVIKSLLEVMQKMLTFHDLFMTNKSSKSHLEVIQKNWLFIDCISQEKSMEGHVLVTNFHWLQADLFLTFTWLCNQVKVNHMFHQK